MCLFHIELVARDGLTLRQTYVAGGGCGKHRIDVSELIRSLHPTWQVDSGARIASSPHDRAGAAVDAPVHPEVFVSYSSKGSWEL